MRLTRGRFLLLVLVLALQELLVRFLFPLPELRDFNRARYMPLGSSPTRRATTVANLDLVWTSSPDQAEFVHHLNAYGFRDRTWRIAKPAGRARVAFIGDSHVEGLMAPDDGTIPVAFAACASAAGHPVETMNLGIGGLGLTGAIQLALDITPVFRPDVVYLVIFANDLPAEPLALAPRPLHRFTPWEPRLLTVLRLWRDRASLPIRGRRPRARFLAPVPDPDNPWSAPDYDAVIRRHVTPDLYAAMRAGTFNPSRTGGTASLADPLREPVEWRAPLQALQRALLAQGAELRIAYIPYRAQVTSRFAAIEAQLSQGLPQPDLTAPDYQRHARELTAQCAELGIPFLDLTPALRAADAAGENIYWPHDDHPRAAGYRTIAKALWNWSFDP